MPIYTPLFTDTFHRANEAPLNPANYTNITVAVGSELEVASNVCAGDGTAAVAFEVYTGAAIPNDQYAEITVASYYNPSTGFGAVLAVVARSDGTDQTTGYTAQLVGLGNGTSQLDLVVGTTINQSTIISTVNVGDVLRIEALGTAITVKLNGTVKFTVTDATYTSGKPGLEIQWDHVQSDTTVSLFTAGSIVSSGSGPQNVTVAPGQNFATRITSPRTAVIGTNLGTKIL